MTTIVTETVKCGCCGKKSKQRGLGSTNQFGSADLDLRPPPMARDTMEYWLQTCPGCGLVAEDLAAETPAVADLVRSDAYRRGGLDRAAPDLALTFLRQATIEATHVPYRGAAPAITDLLGGQIQFLIVGAAPVIERIRSGSLRVLGTATANRIATLPDVPTIAEAGLPGYASTTWFGIVAPAGTDPAVVGRLNGLLREFTADADTRQKFAASFFEPMPLTPDAFASLVREDHSRWRDIVTAAGVKPE